MAFKSYVRKSAPKQLFGEKDKDMQTLCKEMGDMEQRLAESGNAIAAALDDKNFDGAKELTTNYNVMLHQYFIMTSALVKMYEKKIVALSVSKEQPPISKTQEEQINKEVKELEKICCLGLKGCSDVKSILEKNIFSNLLENFEEKCPLLLSIIQTLLVTDSGVKRVHKTCEYKLTCGVNTLALLLSVRNQKCNNDIRLILGLVCITYGAGKQFINLLNAVGLTPHWDTLYVYCISNLFSIIS